MPDPQPIVRLEKVSKAFNGQQVLRAIDLEIHSGQTTVVIGPSGCGKSVLLKHIAALLRPDSGKVFFRETEISALPERHLGKIRSNMGFLFQGGALFDSMTVEENICFPLAEHNVGNDTSRKGRCREVLALVGMDGTQDKYPEELSGGQKKRVALARAVAMDPQLILYDEPTTGLDPIRADLINELILILQTELGNTAIVVTHDMTSARKVADRIVMLHEGQLIVDATPEQLDRVDDRIVQDFIHGRASQADLSALRQGAESSASDSTRNRS